MFINRLTYTKVIFWLMFILIILATNMLDPAQAKSGKNKNAQHGRGEAFRELLDRVQKAGVPVVVGKKQRVKAARKYRNQLKTIGKKIGGINHSMKPKR
jgi:hypothetical protein